MPGSYAPERSKAAGRSICGELPLHFGVEGILHTRDCPEQGWQNVLKWLVETLTTHLAFPRPTSRQQYSSNES